PPPEGRAPPELEGARRVARRPATAGLKDGSVLEDAAPFDGIATPETVALRAESVWDVVAWDDHVVELPDRAVLPHSGNGVVAVELPGHALVLAAANQLSALRLPYRVYELVLLRDRDLPRIDFDHTP